MPRFEQARLAMYPSYNAHHGTPSDAPCLVLQVFTSMPKEVNTKGVWDGPSCIRRQGYAPVKHSAPLSQPGAGMDPQVGVSLAGLIRRFNEAAGHSAPGVPLPRWHS